MSDEQQQASVPFQDEGPELRNIVVDGQVWWAVVDFIAIWTESADPANYWRNMKKRADTELEAFIAQALRKFPFKAGDNRLHQIDTATEESLLRLVQSVPSKNAERIKLLLAKWGTEKIQEIRQGPSPIELKRQEYRSQGYNEAWIDARIADLLARNEITETWKLRGARETDYAMLTNTLTEGTFGLTIKSYKVYKSIATNANLPDNMTPQELAFNILSKTTASGYHEDRDSQGTTALHRDVYDAGQVTGDMRKLLEERTGRSVVSSQNAKDLRKISPERKKKRFPAAQQQQILL